MLTINAKGAHLSPQQSRLWHWAQDKPWYRVQYALKFTGEFEPDAFQQALQDVVDRHAILRTTFVPIPGIELPMQAINQKSNISYHLIDLEQLNTAEQQASQETHWYELLERPFNLEYGPLLYANVLHLSSQTNILMVSLHALNADAATLKQFNTALFQAYTARLQNSIDEDDPLQYVNVTAWLNELLHNEDAEEPLTYWRKLDLSQLNATPLPFQRNEKNGRPQWNASAQEAYRPQQMPIALSTDLQYQLQQLGKRFDVSTEAILLASWQTLLWRLTDNQDLLIGMACDGRPYEELVDLIGPYSRMVPITISLTDQRPFSWVLLQMQQSYQQALERQLYFNWETGSENRQEQPLSFPISFVYESLPEPTTYGSLTVEWQRQECRSEPSQLQLYAQQSTQGLHLQLAYNASIFSEVQIQRLTSLFIQFLTGVTAQPEIAVGSLALLTPQAQAIQQKHWCGDQHGWPFIPLHQRFQDQVQRHPSAPALRSGDVVLSYQELEETANQLAHLLLSYGIQPGQRVALYQHRNQWTIISLLAVLKAGGCYAPLDEDLPASRVQFLLQQLAPVALICNQDMQKHLGYLENETFPVIQIEALSSLLKGQPTTPPQVHVQPQQNAYVIYTSGSTGTPKGVQISQHSISNYTQAMCELLKMQAGWHVATVSSLAADLGNTAIFCALTSGSCLHLLPYTLVTDGAAFTSYVKRYPLDMLKIVPTHLQALLAADATGIIPRQRLILGGEALSWTLIEQLQHSQNVPSTCQIYNHYGPTETTVGALVNPLGHLQTIHVPAWQERGHSVPIGYPLANLRIAIWDSEYHAVPRGVKGELYIAGAGVALGYLGAPDLTEERFLTIQHTRWYRTGDMVRENEEGLIEFIGRRDSQVKLRGYRIEMDEIEDHLRKLPTVREAVVQLRSDGSDGRSDEPYLVGYIVPWKQPGPEQQAVREALAQQLPSYLVPTRIVNLEQFPLSPNGKLDRQRLPVPENVQQARVEPVEEARTPIETLVQQIWRQILDVQEIGRHDDFFQSGGHSLLGTRMIAQVRSAIGVEIPIAWLFESPTVSALSLRIEEVLRQEHGLSRPPLIPVSRNQALPLSFAQQRLWFLDQLEPGSTAYTIPQVIHLQGVLDRPALQEALHTVIQRHENLRTSFPSRYGEPWQHIHPHPLTPLRLFDLRTLSPTLREEQARQLVQQGFESPFDLEHGPLLRSWLLQISEQEHILLLTMHHIISDGWSSGRLVQEMTMLYEASQHGRDAKLPVLPIQYADFALWQRSWLQGEVLEYQLDYWKTRLSGLAPLDLPTDHPRQVVQSFQGARQQVQLTQELTQQLHALAQHEGVTLFMLLLAAFQVLLTRYSGQRDIAVGTPIANRTHEELEGLIGFFVNMLVMRGDLSDNPAFTDLLKQVRTTALEAYAHQDVPFEQVVEAVPFPRMGTRSPLFQVVFALQNTPETTVAAESFPLQAQENDDDLSLNTAKFELTLIMYEGKQGLHTTLEYATELFTESFIVHFLSHWQRLLTAIVTSPEQPVFALPLLDTAQHAPIYLDWHILPAARMASYEEAVGHPLTTASLLVLDDTLQPVPANVVGQLYLANLDLTGKQITLPIQERLIPNPWKTQSGEQLYSTGNRVRYNMSGILEYLDYQEYPRQITIDGSLISLDKLEMVMHNQTTIQNCRLLVRKNVSNIPELVAYVVTTTQGSPTIWQEQLRASLPDVWIPRNYIAVSHLPLTDTGDIDDRTLLAMAPLGTQALIQWEQYLRKQDGIEQVAIVIQDYAPAQLPLHLNDLLPERKAYALSQEMPSNTPVQQEHRPTAEHARLALSEGSSLQELHSMTLPQALLRAARENSDAQLIYLLPDGTDLTWTYQQLLTEAQRILGGLRQLGICPHDRVILQVEWSHEFLSVFWACQLGGMVPVPVSIAPTYERPTSVSDRLFHAWQMLDQPIVVAGSNLASSLQTLAHHEGWDNFQITAVNSLQSANILAETWYESQPEDLALILLTSGSTGTPKGVMQKHVSLLSMAAGVAQSQHFHNHEITLNWMPLDHVGGIIMFHVRDVYLGCSQVQVPTQLILQDPLRWLDLIERYRVTITWAPNFAFGLVNNHGQEIAKRQWDLSSLHFILNGGEAIVAKVARHFMELLQPHRLSSKAMHPAWGMSETSSGIVFSSSFALDSTSDEDQFVVVGDPIPGISIRIVDDQDQLAEEGTIGHLQAKGTTITSGYYQNPQANQEVFHPGGWFDTGDLGILHDGKLTITGRAKDVIIINGVNYYSQEIEAAIEELEEIETSYTAACAVRNRESATDQLAIFVVSRVEDIRILDVIKKVRAKVSARVGVTPAYILPVTLNDIPKTAIGKIQRTQLKQKFESGTYQELLKDLDQRLGNANTIPDWFYRKSWQRCTLRQQIPADTENVVLILADDFGIGRALQEQVHLRQQRCIYVERGATFAQLAEDHYQIEPEQEADYFLLGAALMVKRLAVTHVAHLWGYRSAKQGKLPYNESVSGILHLVRSLAHGWSQQERREGEQIKLVTISEQVDAIQDNELHSYEQASVAGLVKTITRELPWLDCVHVDVSANDPAQNASYLLQELTQHQADQEVAYRDGQRFVARLEHINWAAQPTQTSPLVPQGFYVISGGMGGLGYELACHLLQDYQAHLLLLGRTSITPEQQNTLSSVNRKTPAARLAHLQLLAQQGGAVRYAAVDVCDLTGVQQAVEQAQQEWERPLDGIFHLAGEFHEQVLLQETAQQIEQTLRPKIAGAWTLHQLLKDRPGALFVSYSSVNAFFGGRSVGAYAAANRFLEDFAHYQRVHCGLQSYCISWSMWDEVGMSLGYQLKEFSQAQGYQTITLHQGWYSLLTILRHQLTTVLVGLDAQNHAIRPLLTHPAYALQEAVAYVAPGLQSGPSQGWPAWWGSQPANYRLKTQATLPLTENGDIDIALLGGQSYSSGLPTRQEPRTDTEQQILDIWCDVLKNPQISVLDNFFELGGHSLLATQVTARLQHAFQIDIPVRNIFEHPTIASLAQMIDLQQQRPSALTPIKVVERDQHLPLSFAQQRLWFLDQLEPASTAYVMPSAVRLQGMLDRAALQQALYKVTLRHENLRTTFPSHLGEPWQQIHSQPLTHLLLLDMRALSPAEREEQARQIIQQEAIHPFNLAQGPLLRNCLLQLADEEHILLLTMHHIISDGWSINILVRELTSLYTAFSQGQAASLPALPVQYVDYALWQRSWLQGEALEQQLNYWKTQLAASTPLELPTDYPRPANQSFRGARLPLELSAKLSQKLRALSQREGATLFMTLATAFQVLLARYSGQSDITIGTPIANRTRKEIEGLIGFFTNTLALRCDLSNNPTFVELLAQVRRVALEAYTHQEVPFEQIVDAVQPERDLSRSPIIQVLFQVMHAEPSNEKFAELHMDGVSQESVTAKFDITLAFSDDGEVLQGSLEYATDLFHVQTMERLIGHWQTLLEGVVAYPDTRIAELPLVTANEYQLCVEEWNATQRTYSLEQCLHQLIETQVEHTPYAPAVGFEHTHLTYQQFNERANQLAHYLQRLGVGAEVPVGVYMERSIEMVVALVGILKAGGAYVPLDPTYPAERLEFMLEDVAVSTKQKELVVLTQARFATTLSAEARRIVCLDTDWKMIAQEKTINPVCAINSDNAAYIIYTSGSTGKPKGVVNTHRGICNRLLWMQETYPLTEQDRVLQKTPFSFDVSIWEFFWPLITGAQLIVARPEGHKDSGYLVSTIQEQKITILHFVPSMLQVFLEEPELTGCTSLKQVFCSGEALSFDLQEHFFSRHRATLHNLYGPTEAAIEVAYWNCQRNSQLHIVPIGRPIANIQLYILNQQGQPTPIGVPGELHIGGVGVARGYLSQPELTAERFIPDPFSNQPGTRLYRTGDLTRYLPDGTIEYLGRLDDQIKLRGFRIELGEIEAVINTHAAISAVVVGVQEIVRGGIADKHLVAYVVRRPEQALALKDLRSFIGERLPQYMLPTDLIELEQLPLSPSGKVNRKQLPALKVEESAKSQVQGQEPRNELEELVWQTWKQILQVERPGIQDNFFEIGGHSLLATQLISRLRQLVGVELPVRAIFEAPTIAQLTIQLQQALNQKQDVSIPPLLPISRNQPLPLSFAQQRLWFLNQLEPENTSYNMPSAFRLQGPLSVDALCRSWQAILIRHEVLRTTFGASETENEVVQRIIPDWPKEDIFSLIDLSQQSEEEQETEVRRRIKYESQQIFDLTKGPLVRLRILKLGPESHIVLAMMHHIVSDGWSMSIFQRELTTLYNAFVQDKLSPLAPLALQYADFSYWQRSWLQGETLEKELAYWKQQLVGMPEVIELPLDHDRPAIQSYQGAQQSISFSTELTKGIRELSQQAGATLFMTSLTAFLVLLWRYSNQDDIVVGTPIANRTHEELEGLIGFFANTLVLRTSLAGNPTFRTLLQRVREVTLGAYSHQDVPFEKLVEVLRPERNTNHTPLIQAVFTLPLTESTQYTFTGLTIDNKGEDTDTSKFDLVCSVINDEQALQGRFTYNRDLFESETIQRLLSHWLVVLENMISNPDQHIGDFPLVNTDELEQFLSPWKGTDDDDE